MAVIVAISFAPFVVRFFALYVKGLLAPPSCNPENRDVLSGKRIRTNPEALANREFPDLSLLYCKGIPMRQLSTIFWFLNLGFCCILLLLNWEKTARLHPQKRCTFTFILYGETVLIVVIAFIWEVVFMRCFNVKMKLSTSFLLAISNTLVLPI